MRSRYYAYSLGLSDYIIYTTHHDNIDYTEDVVSWRTSIDSFSHSTGFNGLKIVEFINGSERAFVTFEAILDDAIFREKSSFLKVDGKWLYVSGEFS